MLFGIEGIWSGQESIKYDVVKKMIEDLDARGTLDGLNQNQTRRVLNAFRYEVMNGIVGKRVRRKGDFTLVQVDIWFNIRRDKVYECITLIHIFP